MEFKSGRVESPWSSSQRQQRRRSSLRHNASALPGDTGLCSLQMYLLPPTGDISLEEFDALAVERLQVLRTFERAELSGKQKYSSEWSSFILAELKRLKLHHYILLLEPREDVSDEAVHEACRRDHVSHFILRLAYCRSDDLRHWFITHELALFRTRFLAHRSMETFVAQFLADNDIHITEVSSEQRSQLATLLRDATARLPTLTPSSSSSTTTNTPSSTTAAGVQIDSLRFYTVPFVAAAELVRQRRVLVRGGLAYLPANELVVVAAARLRQRLQRALAAARRHLPAVEHDRRLRALLADFDKQYTGREYGAPNSRDQAAVTADMIDELAEQSFPPCMRQLHARLRSSHKLLHGGRMQYGLFLKAIGLSLQEAVVFWRQEFTQIMDVDKFQKQYLYNIRHNYGQEGKRASYTAHSCAKVMATAGASDAGCPFKHCDRDHLVKLLHKLGLGTADVGDICDTAARGQPQMACQQFWQLSHSTAGAGEFPGAMLQHPNQYYDESRKIRAGGAARKHAGLDSSKFTRANVSTTSSSSQADNNNNNNNSQSRAADGGDIWDDSLTADDVQMALAS